MADQLLKELGIEGVTLHLNTLGDAESRDAWRAGLIEYFGAVSGELSEDSQDRLHKNPLRILDSKDPRDRAFVADAPKIDQFLSDEALAFFESVTSGLDAAGVKWKRAESLVRGLDYYRHTAFEFIPDEGSAAAGALGSQSTVLGGGRYDGLMASLGGAPTPAVGWAAGIERLAMLVGERETVRPDIVVVVEDDQMTATGQAAVSAIRRAGLSAEFIASGGRKKRFDKAVRLGSHVILAMSDGERRLRYQTEGSVRERLVEALKDLSLD